ncbi:MAG: ribosome assembly RNA-binding protein YhbY [Woeseiaceae bacterium]|jgi:RNA-binding protein|nr:ribosome assembly RNA-binding protein YhbY [Woeseiaceae bacterium]
MLTEHQKKHLRGLGHKLRPVIMIGDAGLSTSLLEEYERTLEHHELIKVKIRVGDRAARDGIIDDLCEKSGAELVQRIGNTALLFRRNPEKERVLLPNR